MFPSQDPRKSSRSVKPSWRRRAGSRGCRFDDLPAPDREAHDRKRLSSRKPGDDPRSSIHQHGSCELDKPRESERLLGYGPCPVEFPRCAGRHTAAVGSEDDVWIENG